MPTPAGPAAAEPLIRVRGVVKSYVKGEEKVLVLDGVDLDVSRREWVSLMGPSGSGKTTLLNLIGGLDQPDAGSIQVAGDEMVGRTNAELADWRARNVGYVFQMFNLLPVLTAFQNVELPLLLTNLSRKERREHTLTALELVGLGDRTEHFPSQLSGGQNQRVAIARALVADPAFLLCDEPTGDLDRRSAEDVLRLLEDLHQRFDKAIVMVTHDPHAAERADRLVHLEKGVIVPETA